MNDLFFVLLNVTKKQMISKIGWGKGIHSRFAYQNSCMPYVNECGGTFSVNKSN